jgi:hypothetical protein
MMIVLLFLFQMSGLVQQADQDYGINAYASYAAEGLDQEGAIEKPGWNTSKPTDGGDFTQGDYVAFLGDLDQTSVGKTVREWCRYTKRAVWEVDSLEDWQFPQENPPKLLLLDSAYLEVSEDISRLIQYTDLGISIIFCNLPKSAELGENTQLRELLGIQGLIKETVTLNGVRLFDGFLLGGEAIYEAANQEEAKERQDLDMEVPWYYTGGGVDTYMVGMLSQEQINTIFTGLTDISLINAYLPAILWKHGLEKASVFAVNGTYMEDAAGLGILSAMVSQLGSYDIYPVINAQSMVLDHFPWIASDENEILRAMYNRSSKEVLRDVVWPGIMAIAEQNNALPTCLMQLQFAYDGSQTPLETDLMDYIKLMREQQAEVGLALSPDPSREPKDKIAQDQSLLAAWIPDFSFFSFGSGDIDSGTWEEIRQNGLLPQVRTVLSKREEGQEMITYFTKDVIRQSSTGSGFTHTFRDDLVLKSMETVLAYSTIMVDMEKIAQPDTMEEAWESRSEELAANINTYWKPFAAFDQTTLVQSDAKIRKFLALDYSAERNDNCITVDIEHMTGEADFLLRIHEETVVGVEGGTYNPIENNVYLITADQSHVEIWLKPIKAPFYYEELTK